MSFRFLHGGSFRDCCRPREPAGNCLRSSPRESIRFSSDGRLPHIPSSARTAVWDERCSGVEERCAPSPPRRAEEEQAFAMSRSPSASRTELQNCRTAELQTEIAEIAEIAELRKCGNVEMQKCRISESENYRISESQNSVNPQNRRVAELREPAALQNCSILQHCRIAESQELRSCRNA